MTINENLVTIHNWLLKGSLVIWYFTEPVSKGYKGIHFTYDEEGLTNFLRLLLVITESSSSFQKKTITLGKNQKLKKELNKKTFVFDKLVIKTGEQNEPNIVTEGKKISLILNSAELERLCELLTSIDHQNEFSIKMDVDGIDTNVWFWIR